MPHKTKAPTEEIVKMYSNGFSCEKIANIYDMSRQAVHERLVRNNVEMRSKKVLPFIIYDGIKFTKSEYGYFRATQGNKRIALHRYKYEKEVDIIPKGWDIHHIDGNKSNNKIENLQCISKSEHTKLHYRESKNANN